MSSRYWFAPKQYGYGFIPISYEGWLATAFLVSLLLLSAHLNGILTLWGEESFVSDDMTLEGVLSFVLDTFILGGLACYFFEKKMKEQLKWRWGPEPKSRSKQ